MEHIAPYTKEEIKKYCTNTTTTVAAFELGRISWDKALELMEHYSHLAAKKRWEGASFGEKLLAYFSLFLRALVA